MNFKAIKYHSIFNDPYAFAKEIRQGKIEHYQLEPGNFSGELTQVVSDQVIVSVHKMDSTILQTGTGINEYITFLIPGNMMQDISWREQRLSGKRIGILKSNMWHFAVTPPNFFATPVSLSNSYFNDLIIKYGYDENIYKLIQQKEAIDLKPEDAFQIQQMVITLCNSKEVDYDLMTIALPELILKSIAKIADELPKQISRTRDIIFSKSLAYIHQHLDQKTSTSEICSDIKISERSLRYIFKEMIGLSPMKYIKFIKLNKVRKDIRKAKSDMDISMIANNWDFNHSGQFAADYKKLFGEFPSQTLKG
ncbi:MAG: helix-turn-helix domain-containing protein [Bacteroidales bacterium]|nr:helix-turn-helix domain-containing protein [Bacteroidales bacterium]